MNAEYFRKVCPPMPKFPCELAILDKNNNPVKTDIFGVIEFLIDHPERACIRRTQIADIEIVTSFVPVGLFSAVWFGVCHFETLVSSPHGSVTHRHQTYQIALSEHNRIVDIHHEPS